MTRREPFTEGEIRLHPDRLRLEATLEAAEEWGGVVAEQRAELLADRLDTLRGAVKDYLSRRIGMDELRDALDDVGEGVK